MEETSDDRNGVVVNRLINTNRGTCEYRKLNKRHSNPSGRGEVQRNCSSEIHVKSEDTNPVQCFIGAVDPTLRSASTHSNTLGQGVHSARTEASTVERAYRLAVNSQ